MNFRGSTLSQSGFIPPSASGAVGPEHIVELLNGRYAVYSKTDGTLLQSSTLNQFWSAAGAPPDQFAFDARIVFDSPSQRWFAASVDNVRAANHFLIGVSATSDPTSGWTAFAIDSDPGDHAQWADYTTFGLNHQGVYVAANMPAVGSGFSSSISLLQIPKANLLAPTPSVAGAVILENLDNVGFGVQPAVDLDGSTSAMRALSTNSIPPSISFYVLGLDRNGPTGNLQPINFPLIPLLAPPLAAPQPTIGGAPKRLIDTRLDNFSGSVIARNGHLWAVQSVDIGGRAAIRWFQVRAADGELTQSGTIAHPELALYYPSIAVNEFDQVVIGANGSSTQQPVSSYAFVGETVQGTTTFAGPMLLHAGVDDYQRLDSQGRNRWGDYSATVVDPSDPRSFWTFQQFVSGDDQWAIQITQLKFSDSLPVDADINSDGRVDRLDAIAMAQQYGNAGSPPSNADLDGSGFVALADLALLQNQLDATPAAIPEPSSWMLLALTSSLAARFGRSLRRTTADNG